MEKPNNVVPFVKREKEETEPTLDSEASFDEVIKRNQEQKEKLKAERAKANKGVIRSYRLTPKDKK